jgi:hypothetical protein
MARALSPAAAGGGPPSSRITASTAELIADLTPLPFRSLHFVGAPQPGPPVDGYATPDADGM